MHFFVYFPIFYLSRVLKIIFLLEANLCIINILSTITQAMYGYHSVTELCKAEFALKLANLEVLTSNLQLNILHFRLYHF